MTFAFLVCGGPLWQKSHWWVTGWVMGWSKWTCGELCANLDTIGNSYWFNDDDDVIIEQGNPECHGISISVPLQINCSFWPCSSVLFIWGLYSAWVNPSWLGMTGAYPLTDRNQSKTMPNFTRLGVWIQNRMRGYAGLIFRVYPSWSRILQSRNIWEDIQHKSYMVLPKKTIRLYLQPVQ